MATRKLTLVIALCCLWGVSKCIRCPPDFVLLQDNCYLFATESGSFNEAIQFCSSRLSYLATIETEAESNAINNYISTTAGRNDYWIGGNELYLNKLYYWLRSGNKFHYANWCSGEPNNSGNVEHCAMIHSDESKICWNDINCKATESKIGAAKPLKFLCEYYF